MPPADDQPTTNVPTTIETPVPTTNASPTPEPTPDSTPEPSLHETKWGLVNNGSVPVRTFITFSAAPVESYSVTRDDSTIVVVSAATAKEDPSVFDAATRVEPRVDGAVTRWAEAEPTAGMFGTDDVRLPAIATVLTLEHREGRWVATRYKEYPCSDGMYVSEVRVKYDGNRSGVFRSCYGG